MSHFNVRKHHISWELGSWYGYVWFEPDCWMFTWRWSGNGCFNLALWVLEVGRCGECCGTDAQETAA